MNQAQQRKIQEKLKLMTNYDADQQFMAACDLTEFIEKNYSKLSQKLLIRIIDNLLEHLKSESAEVHGNSIKCLSKIISKIPISQSKRISETMIKYIKDPSTKSDFRDIYGTCVKTIINDVPQEYGDHIKDLLKITIDSIIESNGNKQNTKIELQLIDIAGSFMKKWQKLTNKIIFNREQLCKSLLNNIIKKDENILYKRSYICLGIFSANLNQQQFSQVFFKGGLIDFLEKQNNDTKIGFQKKKFALQALSSVLKSANKQIQNYTQKIFIYLFNQLKVLKQNDDIYKTQIIGQMMESIINSLSSLVKNYPDQSNTLLNQKLDIKSILQSIIVYNPQGEIQYLTDIQIEQQQDEYFMEQEVSDYSWRVRKNGILLIGEISKINPKLCYQFSKLQSLYKTLNQKNQEVINASLQMFESLINGFLKQQSHLNESTLEDMELPILQIKKIKSVYKEYIPSFLTHLHNQLAILFKHKQIDQNTKSESANFLYKLSRFLWHQIIVWNKLLTNYIDLAIENLRTTKSNDIKIHLLLFIQNIFHQRIQYDYNKVLRILIDFSSNNFYKISASAFRAINALLIAFSSDIDKNALFTELINKLLTKFKETDNDQEIKHLVVRCVTQILKNYINKIRSQDLDSFITILANKLNIEVEKRYLLSAVSLINRNCPVSTVVKTKLNEISKIIANSYLNHSDNALKSKSYEALQTCIVVLKENMNKDIQNLIIQKSNQFEAEQFFPEYLNKLIKVDANLIKGQFRSLLKLKNLPNEAIQELIKKKIITLDILLNNIKQQLKNQNLTSFINLLRSLQLNEANFQNFLEDSLWGRLWIGFFGYSHQQKYFSNLLNLTIGNYSDDTKYIASVSLGKIGASNIKKFLPIIYNEFLKQKQKYSLLNSIKQVIINTPTFQNQLLVIQQGLLNNSQIQNQSIINLIAECVGLIINILPLKSKNIVLHYKNAPEINKRIILATSFRYFFNQNMGTSQQLLDFIHILFQFINDVELDVRGAAIKAFNSISSHIPQIIIQFINLPFLNNFKKHIRFDPNFVQVVEFGISKEKVDRGKPIRLDAFTFLEIVMEKMFRKSVEIDRFVLEAAFETLQSDTSNDVLLRRLHIINKITQKNTKIIYLFQKDIIQKFNSEKGKLAEFKEKKANEDQKIQKLLQSILKIIKNFIKSNTKSLHFLKFYEDITRIDRYNKILASLQQEIE